MQLIRLNLFSANAKTTLLCNGFPVLISTQGSISMLLDPYLLENNNITVKVVPEEDAHVTLSIISQEEDATEIDPANTSPGLANIDEDITSEKTYTFTIPTPGRTLGQRFLGPKVDMGDALDYARKLAMLITQKNAEKLAAEMQPKFETELQVYLTPIADNSEWLRTILRDFQFTFDLNKITLEPYCSGRVIRLLHNGDTFLLSKRENETIRTEIFIANVNGTLKVIE